jgi:hypothetical protein
MLSRWLCLSLLLVGGLIVPYLPASPSGRPGSSQEPGAAAAGNTPATLPSTETLPRAYPVLTIQDWCPEVAGRKRPSVPHCQRILSRADFEELVEGINPRMSKAERRDLAKAYSEVLALSQEAVRRGLDKKPRMQALLRYSRQNILAHQMSVELYREAAAASPEEVEKYYASHRAEFDLYTVERIFIPKERQGQTMSLDEAQQENTPSSEGEMKTLAEGIHTRAVGGDDFALLQEKAFQGADIKAPAKVDMEVGRDSLPVAQQEILDLAPGKVSSLLTDDSGFYIYKMVSKQIHPLDSIREQVEIRMRNQRTAELLSKIHKQAQARVNDAYFDKYDPPPPDPNEPDVDTD